VGSVEYRSVPKAREDMPRKPHPTTSAGSYDHGPEGQVNAVSAADIPGAWCTATAAAPAHGRHNIFKGY
jgi:hypothetical protein